MAKRIDNDNDVKESIDSFSDDSGRISIPMGRSALYLLSADYADGYIHWVKLPDGRPTPVVCGGGVAGGGFAPSDCLLCKRTVDLYKAAKDEENESKSDKLKKQGNELRARYSAVFVAAIGELVRLKDKRYEPDFEDAEIGKLAFSQKQYQDFINLRGSEKYPFIKSGKDLTNRVFMVEKKHEKDSAGKKSKFATITFTPSKRTSEPPVEIDLDDDDEYNLDDLFVIDPKEIKKAYKLLVTGKKEKVTNDGDVDFDDDDDEFEDEFEDGAEKSVEDDFDDDIPWEDDEEEKSKKRAKTKRGKSKKK